MTKPIPRRVPRSTLLALAVLLAGCSGSGAVPVRFYVLEPVLAAPAAPAAKAPPSVLVTGVRLPQYLERPQMVTRRGAQIELAEFHQWGGNLRKDMTAALVRNLAARLGSERVLAAPHSMRFEPGARVEVEVLRFERDETGTVRLEARWWVSRGTERALVDARHGRWASAALAPADTFDATVVAMSRVWGELAAAVAQSLLEGGAQ
ncbi:MAG TPA: PqiC family protein [Burkholderiales bacterium]